MYVYIILLHSHVPLVPFFQRLYSLDLSMDGLTLQEKAKLESLPQTRKKQDRRSTGSESCAECGPQMLYQ